VSLLFANGSTDRVNHGQSASIDDLVASGVSILAWVYRVGSGANQHLFSMDGPGATNAGILMLASDALRVLVRRATADADYISDTGFVPANAWAFLAATFDSGASPTVHIYKGSLSALAAEVSYASTADGSGAVVADNANDKWVGNIERANTNPFEGRVARLGYFNAPLSLAAIQRLQFAMAGVWQGAGARLLAEYHGSGTQPDYSGNDNAGAVTGATAADHVPLGPAWGAAFEQHFTGIGFGPMFAGV